MKTIFQGGFIINAKLIILKQCLTFVELCQTLLIHCDEKLFMSFLNSPKQLFYRLFLFIAEYSSGEKLAADSRKENGIMQWESSPWLQVVYQCRTCTFSWIPHHTPGIWCSETITNLHIQRIPNQFSLFVLFQTCMGKCMRNTDLPLSRNSVG